MIGEIDLRSSAILDGSIESRAILGNDILAKSVISEPEVGKIAVIKRDAEEYSGEYEVTPSADAQTLQTKNRLMADDVEIKPIPYYDVSNEFGRTIYIGGNVNA